MQDIEQMGAETDIGGLLRQSLSAARLVTLVAGTLTATLAGYVFFDEPLTFWPILVTIGSPWIVIASLGRIPPGPGIWHLRLAASLAFPILLICMGSLGTAVAWSEEASRLYGLVWLLTIPMLLALWRDWRGKAYRHGCW